MNNKDILHPYSARISKETLEKMDELVRYFQQEEGTKVSKRFILEKAIHELYENKINNKKSR